jgi:hypothetical protein
MPPRAPLGESYFAWLFKVAPSFDLPFVRVNKTSVGFETCEGEMSLTEFCARGGASFTFGETPVMVLLRVE